VPESGQKAEQVWEAVRNIQQIAGDEDPIGAQSGDRSDDRVMTRSIAVKVEIADLHGPPASERRMGNGEPGDLRLGQSDFPLRDKVEELVGRAADHMPDEHP